MRLKRTLTEVADAAEAVRNNVEVHSQAMAWAAQDHARAMQKIATCVWLYGALITAAVIVYVLRED